MKDAHTLITYYKYVHATCDSEVKPRSVLELLLVKELEETAEADVLEVREASRHRASKQRCLLMRCPAANLRGRQRLWRTRCLRRSWSGGGEAGVDGAAKVASHTVVEGVSTREGRHEGGALGGSRARRGQVGAAGGQKRRRAAGDLHSAPDRDRVGLTETWEEDSEAVAEALADRLKVGVDGQCQGQGPETCPQ